MKTAIRSALLLAVLACHSPIEPEYAVILAGGFWFVTMPDGDICRPGPYIRGQLDTPDKAIAECERLYGD